MLTIKILASMVACMMCHRHLFAGVQLICLGFIAASCTPSEPRTYSDSELAALASDAHVVVADTPLVLPSIALPGLTNKVSFSLHQEQDRQLEGERFDAFRKAASSTLTAPAMDRIEVSVNMYGSDDSGTHIGLICSHFSRQWSKSVCLDAWAPLLQAMPRQIYLGDDRQFEAFSHESTVGHERRSDQLNVMRLKIGETSVVCDQEASSRGTRFCTAAILIKGHLAAVWTVWDSRQETSSSQAEKEGKAIVAFVNYAIGQSEDFPSLFSAACKLRRPNRSTGPHGDLCSGPPPSTQQ